MLNMKLRLQFSLMLYLLFIGILIYLNPKFMYDKKGNLKTFGTGSDDSKTIAPLWLIILVLAFLAYYLANIGIYIFSYKYSL